MALSGCVPVAGPAGLAATPTMAKAPVVYTITRLGPLEKLESSDLESTSADAINESGQVVGYGFVRRGNGLEAHAFFFDGGKMKDLGTLNDEDSEGVAVNSAGEVAGGSGSHAFLFSKGRMQDLGTLGGGTSRASAVNSAGEVAGRSELADGSLHAVLVQQGKMEDLGTFTGNYSYATGLNDAGDVVGVYGKATQVVTRTGVQQRREDNHGFLLHLGKMQDLGNLGGGLSEPAGINASGQIVGSSSTADGSTHAFIYQDGHMQDLGTLNWGDSSARAINSSGQIVGTFGSRSHAFLYANGRMHDLNTLVGAGQLTAAGASVMQDALSINDRGQIICRGRDNNGNHGSYLLTPVSSAALAKALAEEVPPSKGWTLKALGTLGGVESMAIAINDSGEVAGNADTGKVRPLPPGQPPSWRDNIFHAFLYRDGKMQDLFPMDGEASEATSINIGGQVVGQFKPAEGSYHAFLYWDGKVQDLGDLGGGFSEADGINASGEIVGRAFDSGHEVPVAFHFSGGRMQKLDLHSFLGEDIQINEITGINDAGLVIGEAGGHAFIYHPDGWMEFPGFSPTAINATGQVVGGEYSTIGEDGLNAFLLDHDREVDLGSLGWGSSYANGINAAGQIVGEFGPGTFQKFGMAHAFIFSDGRMQDLNAIVGEAGLAAAGFKVLKTASGINARGQIVGTGTDLKGHDMAFLLTPPAVAK